MKIFIGVILCIISLIAIILDEPTLWQIESFFIIILLSLLYTKKK